MERSKLPISGISRLPTVWVLVLLVIDVTWVGEGFVYPREHSEIRDLLRSPELGVGVAGILGGDGVCLSHQRVGQSKVRWLNSSSCSRQKRQVEEVFNQRRTRGPIIRRQNSTELLSYPANWKEIELYSSKEENSQSSWKTKSESTHYYCHQFWTLEEKWLEETSRLKSFAQASQPCSNGNLMRKDLWTNSLAQAFQPCLSWNLVGKYFKYFHHQ